VGHLRPTINRDSAARGLLEVPRHPVLRLTMGDWVHPVLHVKSPISKQEPPKRSATADCGGSGVTAGAFYRRPARWPMRPQHSREEVVKLQGGDPVAEAWGLLCDQSRREFQKLNTGSTFRLKNGRIPSTTPKLRSRWWPIWKPAPAVTDDAARCVFLEGLLGKDGTPCAVDRAEARRRFNSHLPMAAILLTLR